MATKDPAFLFYSSDFLTGTMTMTNEQVGKYIRLLCLQHQKKELTEKDIIFICGNLDLEIVSKFIKTENGYINERLLNEMVKRDKATPYKIASAVLGGLISSNKNLTAKQIEHIKKSFNINDFLFDDKELIKSSINKWLSECLTIYVNENVIENINITKDIIVKEKKKDIPTENEFLDYCKEVLQSKYIEYEFSLISKYKTWIDDGWKTGHNKPIKNWKNTINNTIQYLKPIKQTENGQPISKTQNTINVINRLLAKHGADTNQ